MPKRKIKRVILSAKVDWEVAGFIKEYARANKVTVSDFIEGMLQIFVGQQIAAVRRLQGQPLDEFESWLLIGYDEGMKSPPMPKLGMPEHTPKRLTSGQKQQG